MTFKWRKFLLIAVVAGLASFATFLLIQYLQGHVDDIMRTATKSVIMALGLGLVFALERTKKDYPWMG